MSKQEKTLNRILGGTSNANVEFADLCTLLSRLGFKERINSSHHIYTKAGIEHIINIQASRDGKAKPYQVRQVRQIIEQHGLKL